MAKTDVGYLPHGNPCAQCGKPIAAPDWIENGPRRISYLWHCQACDYRFEAVAFFEDVGNRSSGGLIAALRICALRRPTAGSAGEPAIEYERSIHAAAGH